MNLSKSSPTVSPSTVPPSHCSLSSLHLGSREIYPITLGPELVPLRRLRVGSGPSIFIPDSSQPSCIVPVITIQPCIAAPHRKWNSARVACVYHLDLHQPTKVVWLDVRSILGVSVRAIRPSTRTSLEKHPLEGHGSGTAQWTLCPTSFNISAIEYAGDVRSVRNSLRLTDFSCRDAEAHSSATIVRLRVRREPL